MKSMEINGIVWVLVFNDVVMFRYGLRTCKLDGCVHWVLVNKLVNWENKKIYVGCMMLIRNMKSYVKCKLKI
jgi:hypothetical protein